MWWLLPCHTWGERYTWSCDFPRRLPGVTELLGWISRWLCSGASARRPWGTSAFWLSQSSFISLLWCFCFPLYPSGNNGVHGSVESANTPSIMTCCAALYCLHLPGTWCLAVIMAHAYIDNLFSQSPHRCLNTSAAAAHKSFQSTHLSL